MKCKLWFKPGPPFELADIGDEITRFNLQERLWPGLKDYWYLSQVCHRLDCVEDGNPFARTNVENLIAGFGRNAASPKRAHQVLNMDVIPNLLTTAEYPQGLASHRILDDCGAFKDPWFTHIKSIIQDRYTLLPTIYSWMERATRTSEPFVSPLPYHFPAEEPGFAVDDQYMFGDRLMVAPITQPGSLSRDVYFPGRGTWIEIHSGAEYASGKKLNVPAPIEYIPVFAREGAQIVRQQLTQHTGEVVSPDLAVDVFPGQDSVFSLYEDDGHSLDYTRGEYIRTTMRLSHGVNGITWETSKEAGNWKPTPRAWTLRFYRIYAVPRAVTLNGTPLAQAQIEGQPGWRYDAAKRQIMILLLDTGSQMEVRIRP